LLDFDDPNAADAIVSNLISGDNVLIWTLSTDACPNYHADTLVINLADAALPFARNDQVNINRDSQFTTIDLVLNDSLSHLPAWELTILSDPNFGTASLIDEGTLIYELDPTAPDGLVNFSYEICNLDCSNSCDTATIAINIETRNIDPDIVIPSGITPNEDGANDFFVIPDIQNNPERYDRSELVIFNRWGDVVYSAQPYQNDWDGRNNSGKKLPQGTYYYVLRVDFTEGKIYRGDITLLR
ncbi:MAG: gliding motility-associated C-terminal domain-containing protein, partial [Bacteroidota bacterium]